MIKKSLYIDGVRWKIRVEPLASLAALLQRDLSQYDECGVGDCEDCYVIVNGEITLACTTPLWDLCKDTIITTKKGIAEPGILSVLQLAWVVHGSPGCFRCAGKIIRNSAALLEVNPFPTRKEIESWCKNQFFRCCNNDRMLYKRIDAIMEAARVVRNEIGVDELVGMITTEKKIIDINEVMSHNTIAGSASWGLVPELGIRLPPETLHLALVRAGVFNAQLLSIEVHEALKVPGVYRVITSYDVKGSNILSGSVFSSENNRSEFNQPVLCREEIKSKDEVIAVVCADSQQNALRAARKIKAAYKFIGKGYNPRRQIHNNNREPICHPEAYNIGFARLDKNGKMVIHSRFPFPKQYGNIIADAIGLHEEQIELLHGNGVARIQQSASPIMEAILGLAFLSTGRPVFLKCSNFTGKNSGSVTVQWIADKC
jgi:aldehyde oxidoreductase